MDDSTTRPRLYDSARKGFNTDKRSATTLWAVRGNNGELILQTHDDNHPQPSAFLSEMFLRLLAEEATRRYGSKANAVFDAADGCEVDYLEKGDKTYHLRVRRFGTLSNRALNGNRIGVIEKPGRKRRGEGRRIITLQGHGLALISNGQRAFGPHLRYG